LPPDIILGQDRTLSGGAIGYGVFLIGFWNMLAEELIPHIAVIFKE
jgi:hypothetical protein